MPPLNLTHCTALHTVGLCINPIREARVQARHAPVQSLSWVQELLQSISSPSLEHVHLRIKAGGATYEDVSRLDWARVADVLSGRQFGSLRRLTFEIIRGSDLKHALIPYIKERLAGLDRGERVRMRELAK